MEISRQPFQKLEMHIRILFILAGASALLSIVAMVIGHAGEHALSWKINQISTYAATAPHGRWVTTSMLFSCSSLIILAILVAKFRVLGNGYLAHLVPLLVGATTSGLLMLAAYEETARNISLLKKSSFMAIRQQSFHDAGLLIFFYGGIVLVLVLGVVAVAQSYRLGERINGVVVLLLGLVSFPLMTSPWPIKLGFHGSGAGLQQRASLFCLWLAIIFILVFLGLRLLRRDSQVLK